MKFDYFFTFIHEVYFLLRPFIKFDFVVTLVQNSMWFIFSTENNVYHFDFQATLTECNIFRPKNEQQCWIFWTKVIM